MTTHYSTQREYVGSITENGEAFCFGAALDDEQVVYLDVAGPTETIKTIRAKLVSHGRLVYLNPPRGRTIYLTPSGPRSLTVIQKKIAYGLVHALFVPQAMTEPSYSAIGQTYIIRSTPDQLMARLTHHIHQLVPIPVRSEWQDYLLAIGQRERLIRPCTTYGGIDLLAVTLDQQAWQTLIQQGLHQQHIQLLEKENSHGPCTI